MASDFGQAGERLGPDRINIVGVIVGGGGNKKKLFILPFLLTGEQEVGNRYCFLPSTLCLRNIGFAITGEGKLASVEAA